MFEEAIRTSNIIEYVSEMQTDSEDAGAIRIIVRLTNETAWPKLMVKLLKQAVDDEDYYVQIAKEFYLDEQLQPKFAWVISVQGDLDLAKQNLTPILAKRVNASALPTPPAFAPKKEKAATQAPSAPAPQSLKKRTIRGETEVYEATTVSLPFRRGNRDRDAEEVVRVMDGKRGIRAAVRGVTG